MEFLANFFLVIFIFYLVATLVFRYALPFVLKRYMNKLQGDFNSQFATDDEVSTKKEGNVTIIKPSEKRSKNTTDQKDDYIDFEEVKD